MKFFQKNILLLAFFCLAHVNDIFSQDWYTGFSAGYGMGVSKSRLAEKYDYSPNGNTKSTVIAGTLGKGLYVNATVGKKLHNNISAEIIAEYFSGAGFKVSNQTYDWQANNALYNRSYSLKKIHQVHISPGLKISVVNEKKLKPFARFGAVFGFATSFLSVIDNPAPSSPFYSETKYNNNIAYGFRGSLGADYQLSNKISLFFEITSNNLSWAAGKSEITKWTKNGIDQIPLKTISELQIEYVKDPLVNYYSGNPNPNKSEPDKWLKQYYSFNSLVFSIGFTYTFGYIPDKTETKQLPEEKQ